MSWRGRGAWIGVVVAACGSSSSHPPGFGDSVVGGTQDDGGRPNGEVPPSSTISYEVKVGGSLDVTPGTKVGYALTASQLQTYRFRWTGDAAIAADGFQHFYGSAWTTGHFTSLTPGCDGQVCPLEAGDFVSSILVVSGGERIDWNTSASTGWDGFSFAVDTEPVYFDVFIDGARHPELFYFPARPKARRASPS